jgi:hypothetical protein
MQLRHDWPVDTNIHSGASARPRRFARIRQLFAADGIDNTLIVAFVIVMVAVLVIRAL